MKESTDNKRRFLQFLLFVLPVLYFIAASYFRNLLGLLSLRSCDPEYIYFMSGLTLSDGAIKLGHIDNPGTPLQILVALVFRITWMFRSHAVPYVEDVLLHPDLYLSVVSLSITVFTTILLIYAGLKTYRYTRSVLYSLLVQTAPFLPVIWYDLIGRVAPELMMPFPIVLLTVLIIKILFDDRGIHVKRVLLFALLSAFGLAVKLTFLPLWLVPILVIDGWKKRMLFVGASVFFFFLIAFPVTLQIETFWGWVKNLFMHSGRYGGGETNIIDFTLMKENLNQLYGLEKSFFYLCFGLLASALIYLAVYRKKAERKILLLSLALIITLLVQIIMVGKHYAHRYFIPALLLYPMVVITTGELLKKLWNKRLMRLMVHLGIVCLLIWKAGDHRKWLPVKSAAMETDIQKRLPTWHFASQLNRKDNYLIITSQNYGSPFIEYTLTYSLIWANYEKRMEYAPILDRLYPHTFNYFTWDNSLKSWVEKFDAQSIINSKKEVYLYMERSEEDLYEKTLTKLKEESISSFTAERELLFRNEHTQEIIYRLELHSFSRSDSIAILH